MLGVVEGLTEFLPVSSTGHLTVTERLFNLKIDDPGVTAFTAVVQFGAVVAVLIYFRHDLWRLIKAGVAAIREPSKRSEPAAREAGFVVIGTIPIAIVGLAAKHADRRSAAQPRRHRRCAHRLVGRHGRGRTPRRAEPRRADAADARTRW